MFLNDSYIQSTFMREGLGLHGEREVVLVVKMNEEPESLRETNPKHYESLSEKLNYLETLAKHGFLDFNRIEVLASDAAH